MGLDDWLAGNQARRGRVATASRVQPGQLARLGRPRGTHNEARARPLRLVRLQREAQGGAGSTAQTMEMQNRLLAGPRS